MALQARALYEQALTRLQAREWAQCLEALRPLLDTGTDQFEVLALAAAALEPLGRHGEALVLWRRLAQREPLHAGVQCSLGRTLAQCGQPQEALEQFDAVIARDPAHAEAWLGRGNVLRLLLRREEAIEAYRAVLPLHAEYARLALVEIFRQQQALLDMTAARITALQLYHASGGSLDAIGLRLANEHHIWPPDPAGIAVQARELGVRYAAQAMLPDLPASSRAAGQGLRIGLVSADLGAHPVGYFAQALLDSSAARAAEWLVYSNRVITPDALTDKLRARAARWHEVLEWPDDRLARQIREDGIDVLVDLSGYSAYHRLAAFAARPAPLQLSWLGYHGTTGLPYIDAVIADPVCVPPGEEHFFTEPLLRLPQTRLCYTPQPDAPPVAPAPALTRGHVTFGCFQQAMKLGPQVLAAWARIAQALPDARWRLLLGEAESDSSDWQRLRARCAAAGFAPRYLEIFGRLPYAQYLAAHAEVDLMLDTFPYPGGTTTADALWMGVPTLTLSTPGMLGRQGEQLLRAAQMPEWVTHSVDEYVTHAVERARSAPTAHWSALRPALRERLRTTPLFDGERFGRDWMAAVRECWQRKSGSRSFFHA